MNLRALTPIGLAAFIFVLALTQTGIPVAKAQSAAVSAETGTWALSPTYVSQYLFRGVRLAGASFQPAIEYSTDRLVLGVWSSTALSHHHSGDSDPEIDLYGSYSFPVGEKLKLVPGYYLYTYPDAKRSNGLYSATFEPSLAAVFSAWGVQFTPKVYYDLMLDGPTAELSAAMALPLKTLGTELDFVATVGTFRTADAAAGENPSVKNWGDYWLVGVSVPVQVSLHSEVIAGFTYSEGRENYYKAGTLPRERNDAAGRHGAVSLTYSISF